MIMKSWEGYGKLYPILRNDLVFKKKERFI